MHDRIDEWVAVGAHRVRRQAAAVGRQGRPRPERARRRGGEEGAGAAAEEHKGLVERMQKALGDRASAVRVTHRLTDSPACLVSDEHGDEHEPRAAC